MAPPHYICFCVFSYVFFVFDTSVVGVGGWAPGCADNVSGKVRHPLIIFVFVCFFYVFWFSIKGSLVSVLGTGVCRQCNRHSAAPPNYFCVCVYLCFFFDTSVVGVGGWAPGCADNVSGTVRHPLIIFTFFTV